MIEFFRKIIKNLLLERPPSAKVGRSFKYAVGEILLVVIGILIAVQTNNWNTKNNSVKEKSILEDIHQEFLQNKMQLDTVVFYNKRAFKNGEKLASLFPIVITMNNMDSIASCINDSLFTYTFNPSRGSINSIISTSSFNIIQNKKLRTILISWRDLVTDLQENEIIAKRIVYESIDSFLSGNFDYYLNFKDKRNNLNALETLNM